VRRRSGTHQRVVGPRSGPVVRSRGQATVEFALLLPFVVVVLLALIQVGLLVRNRVLVTHAAREAARVAAVGGSDADAIAAALVSADLRTDRMSVDISRDGERAQVVVQFTDPTDVPIVGGLIGDVALEATARMRLEDGT